MKKDSFEFEVLVNGTPVKEYCKEHQAATFPKYIEGKKGTKYSLRFRNNFWNRVLIIPTVDGLNVLTGKKGSFNDRGYIIDGHDSMVIDGWRTSNKEVARFFFSNPEESYAEKMDKGGNLGIIGCAVFKEKIKFTTINIPTPPIVIEKHIHHEHHHCDCWKCNPYKWYQTTGGMPGSQLNTCYNTQNTAYFASCCNTSGEGKQELGTGFGERKFSEVVTVDFDRENNPVEIFEIYYNTRQQLEAIGVDFKSRPQYAAPSAFPDEDVYCPIPKE